MPSVLQDWVQELTLMQQSVLISSIRGPDGLHKNHCAKYILRWLRRCVLLSAFDKRTLTSPTEPGGGSFTGPLRRDVDAEETDLDVLERVAKQYLQATDEVPHHFHMHLLHSAEILGYKHPQKNIADFWHWFYQALCSDAHLHPETQAEMERRLGDVETQWRERELVPAADSPVIK